MNIENYTLPVDPTHEPEVAGFIDFFNGQNYDERRRGLMFLIRKTIFDLDAVLPNATPDEREDAFQTLIAYHDQLTEAAELAEGATA